jgi:hypothetical protein
LKQLKNIVAFPEASVYPKMVILLQAPNAIGDFYGLVKQKTPFLLTKFHTSMGFLIG